MDSSKAVAAMTAGRQRKAAERLKADVKLVREYRKWCTRDAELYSMYVTAREAAVPASDDAIAAYELWYIHLKLMPELPDNKKAWEQA